MKKNFISMHMSRFYVGVDIWVLVYLYSNRESVSLDLSKYTHLSTYDVQYVRSIQVGVKTASFQSFLLTYLITAFARSLTRHDEKTGHVSFWKWWMMGDAQSIRVQKVSEYFLATLLWVGYCEFWHTSIVTSCFSPTREVSQWVLSIRDHEVMSPSAGHTLQRI